MTALEIIEAAFRSIGIASTGNPLSAEDAANGLEALQMMLGRWVAGNLALFCYQIETASVTAGTAAYTIGATGDIAVARPPSIEKIYVRDSNSIDYPTTQISAQKYARISDKSQSGRSLYWWYNPTYPNGTLTLWPVPDGSSDTLIITMLQQLSSPINLTDDMEFPEMYNAAMRWCLAVELAPEYGVDLHPYVSVNANASFAQLQQVNAATQIEPVSVSLPAGIQDTYDIEAG